MGFGISTDFQSVDSHEFIFASHSENKLIFAN